MTVVIIISSITIIIITVVLDFVLADHVVD